MKKLSFNIIGAGAMGHLWASFLAHAGFRVKLYARTQRDQRAFSVQSPLGNFGQTIQYSTLAKWQDADVTLICVKANQLKPLCLELSQLQVTSAQFLLMMNGMGLVEMLQEKFPLSKVIHASIVHGVYIQDNRIIHTGKGKTVLGHFDSALCNAKDFQLIEQLNLALPEVFWNENHQEVMNLKLIINAIINPISSLNNQTNQSVLLNGQLNAQAEKLLIEFIPLLEILLPKLNYMTIKQEIESVARNTQSNISSMLQDVRAGKETEIEFINGYLLNLAKSKNITSPLNDEIVQKIKRLSQGY